MRRAIASVALVTAALGASPLLAQENSGRRFTVALTGEAEVKPGDPDGTGTATLRINPGKGQLCYTLRVSGIEAATAAHVHEAPVEVAGPVLIGLQAPTGGSSNGCVAIDRKQALEIIRKPADYYVNVHNAEYPEGALRGQLSK